GVQAKDRVTLEMLGGQPPKLVVRAPEDLFHPNLVPQRPATTLLSFQREWGQHSDVYWLPSFLWDLLTFQHIDEDPLSIVNRNAYNWFVYNCRRQPPSRTRIQTVNTAPHTFHIQERRPPASGTPPPLAPQSPLETTPRALTTSARNNGSPALSE